jgi:hypothetical protein
MLPLLTVFCILLLGVAILRIDTVPGIILGYLATVVLFVAVTHSWRRKRMFILLLAVCTVSFFLLVFLHEVFFDPGMMTSAVPAWQRQIMWSFHMAVSIIVAFVCPVGFLIGAAGSVILWMNRGQSG